MDQNNGWEVKFNVNVLVHVNIHAAFSFLVPCSPRTEGQVSKHVSLSM